MFGNEQVMAVMLEEDDLRLVHREWPAKMRLALSLMPSGDCQLMLFRQEEAGAIPVRLRKHLGLRTEELCIYPPVQGYPTRKLRYSDERGLAALLAESPQLVEDATDYSVNFAFALEEGLDPETFLGLEEVQDFAPTALADLEVESDAPGEVLFATRRRPPEPPAISPSVRKLTFDLTREAARIAEEKTGSLGAGEADPFVATKDTVETPKAPNHPGAAFKPIAEFEEPVGPPSGYVLSMNAAGFVISNGTGARVEISSREALFMRDDRALLAVAVSTDQGEVPATIHIPAEVLPKALKATLQGACGPVELTKDGGFLFVGLTQNPAEPVKTPAKSQVVQSKAKPVKHAASKRRRPWRLLALTTLTAIAILLVLGAQPLQEIKQNAGTGPIDWSQFRLSLQSDQ